MNRTTVTLFAATFAAAAAFGAKTPTPAEFGCEDAKAIIAKGGKLEPGKRYTDWNACKTYADENGLPVLFIWSNQGCIHCRYTDLVFTEENYADYKGYKDFKDWAAKNDAGKVIYCYMAGGEKGGYPDQQGSEAYNWMYYKGGTKLKSFPFVVLWWEKKGVNVRLTGDAFCSGNATGKSFNASTNLDMDSLPDRLPNVIAKMEDAFEGWSPVPPYSGGYFSQTNAPYASLQAEPTTTNVVVEIVRNSLVATNQTMTVENPQGNAKGAIQVDWAQNQLTQTVAIADFDKKYYKTGTKVILQLLDGEQVMSTAEIECCPAENSPTVPKWIGETLDVGEWTMDYAAARDLVKAGKASYLIACIQGSQWCPDCYNVEKNFLGVTNAAGESVFCAWAKKNNIALVTIDIPNYKDADPDGLKSPCLLKREAFLSNPEKAAESRPHSGLGYLTRKMVSDEAAAEVLATNHVLVSTMTDEGGFNRPEERDYAGRAYRTGAPIFVLMDETLKVRAELVRLAEDSPTDAKNLENYLKRFEEMLDIAANEESEIENNYASPEGSVAFKANGGMASDRLCNADMYDTFRLMDVSGNAKQTVTVKGDTNGTFDAECKVTVSFQRLGADGKAVTVGTPASGTLKDGVTVTETLPTAGDYYVQVRGWGPLSDVTARSTGYNSEAFKLTSTNDLHFQCYTVTGSGTVLEPGEDKAIARPAAGTNTVEVNLVEGEIYRLSGLDMNSDNTNLFTSVEGDLYIAKVGGPATVVLDKVDGEFAYQLWHPGTVGFDILEMDVEKGVCDLEGEPLAIPFSRTGGKSGKVTVQIAITNLADALYSKGRIWLTNGTDRAVSELVWEDGEDGQKDLLIWIEDSVDWPEFYSVVDFVVTNVAGEASGAVCREDEDVFSLGVWYEFEGDAGEAHLTDSGAKIYVREGEDAVFYAERSDGRRGLLEVALLSSVEGVTFATANPRDLGTFAEEHPDLVKRYPKYAKATLLWWSSGEEGVKGVKVSGVPAGETAKISFIPLNADNTGFLGTETISIISVPSDAPAFVEDRLDASCYRYVAFDESQAIMIDSVRSDDVTFKKLSGKLPSGLKVAFKDGCFVITGSTTAKSGVYDSVWRVSETRSGKRVDGDTAAIRILVEDVTKEGGGEEGDLPLNPTVAKSRTFKSIPVYDAKTKRLVGTLKLTIPANGKVSGKLAVLGGSASVKAKSWKMCNAEGTLQAELTDSKGNCTMTVEAAADGTVAAEAISGFGLTSATAVADDNVWSKTNPATYWVGNYTVALKHREVISEDEKGIAPTGYGYLTLQMKDSAAKSGTVKVAGVLPNGSKISGSYVLVRQIFEDDDEANGEENEVAYLPIFKVASKEAVGLLAEIAANAQKYEIRRCVVSPEWCDGYWKHTEKPAAKNSYEIGFLLCGSYYDENEDLGGCCATSYETTNLVFYAAGTPLANIKVGADTISINGENPYNLKLSFKRSTGVVTGSFKVVKDTIKHFGVVVNGWGKDCCGTVGEALPFVSGSCTGKKIVPKEVTIDVEKKVD